MNTLERGGVLSSVDTHQLAIIGVKDMLHGLELPKAPPLILYIYWPFGLLEVNLFVSTCCSSDQVVHSVCGITM